MIINQSMNLEESQIIEFCNLFDFATLVNSDSNTDVETFLSSTVISSLVASRMKSVWMLKLEKNFIWTFTIIFGL